MNGYGTVFEIVKTSSGYASTATALASFDGAGADGAVPYGGLIADANGNLLGTTTEGGAYGDGTVFELAKDPTTATGYAVTPITLVSFNLSTNGWQPLSGLIADANGDLFGTTSMGGPNGAWGTVFEVLKDSTTATGYASTPTVLAGFFNPGNGGFQPWGGLIADANGNLFGTTSFGGAGGSGTVFEIVKDSTTATGYASTPTVLASFSGSNAVGPYADLIADANGNLFGTTLAGGAALEGSVFEIAKDSTTATGYATAPTTLASFDDAGADGEMPAASLIADANGNLFSTAGGGGTGGNGIVFEVAKDSTTATGYATAPTTLVSFDGTDGSLPYGGLIADGQGNLFGTASAGGTSGNNGVVFELTGSGFVPPIKFAGIPGSANCSGKSVSALAQTYGGIAHAASSLGYASVAALQSKVASYCGQ